MTVSAEKKPHFGPAAAMQQVALKRIRQGIMTWELPPDAIVTEDLLTTRFGLPKPAVRGVFARLEAGGLILRAGRKEWRVAPLTPNSVRQVAAARRQLEPGLALVVIPLGMDETLLRLAHAGVSSSGQRSKASHRSTDRAVMDRVAQLLSNPFMERWLGELWDLTGRVQLLSDDVPIPDRRPLIEMLAAGQAEQARNALIDAVDAFETIALKIAAEYTARGPNAPVKKRLSNKAPVEAAPMPIAPSRLGQRPQVKTHSPAASRRSQAQAVNSAP
ncbi:MAG: GntR family transcriptional regulator [Pseudomonadota bacterium]